MFIIAAFIITIAVFIFAGWLALQIARPVDEKVEGSRLTKGQWRAVAWGMAVLICLIGAVINYFIEIHEP